MTQSASAQMDQITAALHAPGAPFEIGEIEVAGVTYRTFKHCPSSLSAIYRAAQQFSERELFVMEERRISYAEGLGRAAALQSELKRLAAIGPGDRVAIVMRNCPEWMMAFVAVTALGATAVLVNNRGTAPELAAALDLTDSKIVIADAPRARLIAATADRPMIVVDAAGAGIPAAIDFAAATQHWQQAVLQIADADPDSEAVIMFTSGTTGSAKAALMSHRGAMSCVNNSQFSRAVVGMELMQIYGPAVLAGAAQHQSASLLVFPLFHASGCYAVFLPALLSGAKIVILPKWNAQQALGLVEREKIAAIAGSPTMLWDVLQVDRRGRDLSSIVSIGVGGQALHKKLMQDIAEAFPHALLGIGYGMTETNGSVCQFVGRALLERPTTPGRALPTAELKIIDDDGRILPVDTVGEICVRGAMLMMGYCKNPQATQEALRDGWLRTGDLGRIDAEGFLHVLDRKKDIVISGGENISCSEVEGVAAEIDAVAQAVALGIPDERLGERLVLAVVLRADAAIDDEEIKQRIGEKVAIYKVPRDIYRFTGLPYNAMGKVVRNKVREQVLVQRG